MKIEGKEMKLIALSFLVHPLLILVFSTSFYCARASDALTNPQFHGVSQVLYEFTSSSANNGSGFEGLGRQYGILEHFNRHCDVACTIYSNRFTNFDCI